MPVDRGSHQLGPDPGVGVVDLASQQTCRLAFVVRVGEALLSLAPVVVRRAGLVQQRPVLLGLEQREQRLQAQLRVPHQGMVHRCTAPDVPAPDVELHDGLSLREELPVREVGPHQEEGVTPVEGDLGRRVADQPGLTDLELVVGLEPLLRLQRQHHGGVEPSGELEKLGTRLASALSHQEGHRLRSVERRRRGSHCVGVRRHLRKGVDELRHGRLLGDLQPTHVPWKGQHGHPALLQRRIGCLFDDQGQLVDPRDGLVEHGDVGEQHVVVDLLEEVAAQLLARHLSTDRQDRRMRLLGVVEPVEQVDRAGADGAHADAEPPGQLGLRARCERARLLVPDADPLEAVLAPDRVGHRVQGVADDAPHLGDAVLGEGFDEELGHGGHAVSVRRVVAGAVRRGQYPVALARCNRRGCPT